MSSSFSDLALDSVLLRALDACGYGEPTPIQAAAIPVVLSGQDLIASANTGTGKTAAFVLPALQQLLAPRPRPGYGPRVLVLSPTRELATQILEAVRRYSKFHRVATGAVVGGVGYREQMRMLERRVDLIVATPGRLIDHLERGRLDLGDVEMLVLDEADRMLDMGFLEPVERISSACPDARQTLLFTATVDERMTRLAGRLLKDPARVDIAGRKISHDAIDQHVLRADDLAHKERLLAHLLAQPEVGKTIVFAGTKRDADRLSESLAAAGHAAAALHGDLHQRQRSWTVDNLRRGRIRVLVATDVAARGIDVADVTHVVNFDLPRAAEDYVHRIGRTGRAGATGVAYSLYTGRETRQVRAIEHYIGRPLASMVIAGLEPAEPVRRPGGPRPFNKGPYNKGPGGNGRGFANGKPAGRGAGARTGHHAGGHGAPRRPAGDGAQRPAGDFAPRRPRSA